MEHIYQSIMLGSSRDVKVATSQMEVAVISQPHAQRARDDIVGGGHAFCHLTVSEDAT